MKPGFAERVRRGISRLGEEDRSDLRDFQMKHFGPASHQADPASFAWRFGQRYPTPAEGPAIWICRRDGQIVGQQAGLPARLWVEGRTVDMCWAIDLMVDPAWQLRGIGPVLSQELNARFDTVCGVNVSEPARRAFLHAGWRDLGRVPRLARLIRPLAKGAPVLGSRSANGRTAFLSTVAAPLLHTLDLALFPLLRSGTRLDATVRFDGHAEDVWRRARHHYPVHVQRDLAWLRWRFDHAPHADAYRRYYLFRNDEPIGYAVTRRRNASLMMVDYFCEPGAIQTLFAHCLRVARRESAGLLTCLAIPKEIRWRLAPLGFLSLPGPRLMVAPGAAEQALLQRENWFLTDGDSDLDHDGGSRADGASSNP